MTREQELISSGLVYAIKQQYNNINYSISDKYFILMADYIDSISQLDYEGGLYLNAMNIAKMLPDVLKQVSEENIGGIQWES